MLWKHLLVFIHELNSVYGEADQKWRKGCLMKSYKVGLFIFCSGYNKVISMTIYLLWQYLLWQSSHNQNGLTRYKTLGPDSGATFIHIDKWWVIIAHGNMIDSGFVTWRYGLHIHNPSTHFFTLYHGLGDPPFHALFCDFLFLWATTYLFLFVLITKTFCVGV